MDLISQNKELPNGKMNENENTEFKKIIQQSKEKISDAHSEKSARRKPGRPKKIRPEEKTRESIQAMPPGGPQINVNPAPDMSEHLKLPIQFISKIPAAKHGIPDLALSDQEALACAQGLNGVLQAFVPNMETMDPKTASILSLGVVIGSIGFQKYMIFMAHKPKNTESEKKEPEIQDEVRNLSPTNSESYFNTVRT